MDMIVRTPKSRRLGVSRSVREDYDMGARLIARTNDDSVSDVYNDALKHYLEHKLGPYFMQKIEAEYSEQVA